MQLKDMAALTAEPDSDYHRRTGKEFMSSHLLGRVRNGGLKALHEEEPAEKPDAFRVGQLAHLLILEGVEAFNSRTVIGGPINPRTGEEFGADTKAWREWAKQIPQDSIGCTTKESRMLLAMRESVMRHETARWLLSDGRPELVARTEYCGLNCQSRFDWISDSGSILDLKTCREATFFDTDAIHYGYYYQMAFYGAMMVLATQSAWPRIYIVAVQKSTEAPPVVCRSFAVQDLYMYARANEETLAEIRCYLEELPECEQLRSLLAK